MQAIEITEFGDADGLTLVERDVPGPAKGEVLIRIAAAALNRADIVQRRGFYPPPPGASDIPGLETAGTIEALGAEVDGLEVGQQVCALLTGGGYAEYCVVPQECVLPVPDGMSMIEAAAIPETFFTVWSNVFERGCLAPGDTLLVHGGSSGIGTTAIQLAKAFGARVFVTAGSEEKCAFCRELGADLAINYNDADFVREVLAATADDDEPGVDVILDMVAGDYVPRNIECLKTGGRLVFIAFQRGIETTINLLPFLKKRITLTGSGLRARSSGFKGAIAQDLHHLVWPLLEDGSIKPIVDSTYALAEAADAHRHMETSSHIGKIVLTMDSATEE